MTEDMVQNLWQKCGFLPPGHEKSKQKWLILAGMCGRNVGYSRRDMKKASTRGYICLEFVAEV